MGKEHHLVLDTIPRLTWIRYWLVRNQDKLVSWSIWLALAAMLGAYWPIRNMLIAQDRAVTIHLSNLTVVFVFFLVYVGYFFDWIIKRWLGKRSRAMRWTALACCMGLLLLFLDTIGMKMRWS